MLIEINIFCANICKVLAIVSSQWLRVIGVKIDPRQNYIPNSDGDMKEISKTVLELHVTGNSATHVK